MNNTLKLIFMLFISVVISQESRGGIPYSLNNSISINSTKKISYKKDLTGFKNL